MYDYGTACDMMRLYSTKGFLQCFKTTTVSLSHLSSDSSRSKVVGMRRLVAGLAAFALVFGVAGCDSGVP